MKDQPERTYASRAIESLAEYSNTCNKLAQWIESYAERINENKLSLTPAASVGEITIYGNGEGVKIARLWPDAEWMRRFGEYSTTYHAIIDGVKVEIWNSETRPGPQPVVTPLEL